ncbi:tyrosine-type recombinase/integrase [Paracoccus aminophilus]|uniref:Phage integrase n=1 Tax=Paracoccus aminophilus JCM 7686 TaxID=1367847 RepID=S5YCS5_PARAH|nr:tyrosine-type recombinase/integrase [Paracoccus aminophilus]AGT09258.1 phage integrase [Paracoccus aminophilus JCM 7686]
MAGNDRHWKEKGGRFYARMAVPVALQPILGKTELTAPLGADRREAKRALASAVAALQAQISHAKGIATLREPLPHRPTITTQDYGIAVWRRYMAMLAEDEAKRDRLPTPAAIEAEKAKLVRRFQRNGIPDDPLAVVEQSLDLLVMRNAKAFDKNAREARLDALRRELAENKTHQVEHEIDEYLNQHGLAAPAGSAERVTLAKHLMRAEIEALNRTLERDKGDYTGRPSDPIVKAPAAKTEALPPVDIEFLWRDYVTYRKTLGYMKDGGRRQFLPIQSLLDHLSYRDARRTTKADLRKWQEAASQKFSAGTMRKVYVPTVKALFRWAHDTDRIEQNPAASLRVDAQKVVRLREKGFKDEEAETLLQFVRAYEPLVPFHGKVLEGPRMSAAKRWASLIAAHTGARIGEITQLRREDFREELGSVVIRISPESGTTKTGDFRDVPLHPQLIELGLMQYVETIASGPIFTNETKPEKYRYAASKVANRISDWLQREKLVPDGVWPSHGFRHAFKTRGREAGIQDRILDALQGHAAKSVGDAYGDVTLRTKIAAIAKMPSYKLT